MTGDPMAVIAEDIEHLHDDLARLKLTLRAYCPRQRRTAAWLAVDDLEVAMVKLELAVRGGAR